MFHGYDSLSVLIEIFIHFFEDYLKKEQIKGEIGDRLFKLLNKNQFSITFDFKIANIDPNIEFITLRHPFIKAIIESYKNRVMNTITKISYVDEDSKIEKNYLFFIYLLEIKSFTKSLTFVPVVVDITNMEIVNDYSDNLFNIVKKSKDFDGETSISNDIIKTAENKALEFMISQKRKKEDELKETNESLVNDRLSSLKSTFEIKLKKIDEIVKKMNENLNENTQRIITMKQSEKISLERNYLKKKTQLDSDKKIIVSHELVAGGVLNVGKG